jgi:hypothetical protein
MTAVTDSGSLISERVAGGILPRVLTTFDMVAIFVAIVLFITNAAVIQSAGPSAFGWWVIGFAIFLVPCAVATGQLGAICISIVVLFVDILIILRRYQAQFQARRLAHPAVFWACSVIGGIASLIGIIATLSGSWTPLISNAAGTVSVLGATVAYGTWFWWVGGITVASLAVGAMLYLVGRRTTARAASVPAGAGDVPQAGAS